MEQQNFAFELVRTQALTGGGRSNERRCFLSDGEIVVREHYPLLFAQGPTPAEFLRLPRKPLSPPKVGVTANIQ